MALTIADDRRGLTFDQASRGLGWRACGSGRCGWSTWSPRRTQNKGIAEIPHLSEKTVENHRSNAMPKLGMRDRVELVRYAIRRGPIEP